MPLWMKIFMIMWGIIIIGLVYLSFKAVRTSTVIEILNDAIYDYNIYLINNFDYKSGNSPYRMPFVYQRDRNVFDKTLWRLWDWGYEHILPPEDLEKIRPFIKED